MLKERRVHQEGDFIINVALLLRRAGCIAQGCAGTFGEENWIAERERAGYEPVCCVEKPEERFAQVVVSWKRATRLRWGLRLVRELRAIARQSPNAPAPGAPAPAPAKTPARCSGPGCPYPATGWIDQQPSCAGHAPIYAVCVQASKGIA